MLWCQVLFPLWPDDSWLNLLGVFYPKVISLSFMNQPTDLSFCPIRESVEHSLLCLVYPQQCYLDQMVITMAYR